MATKQKVLKALEKKASGATLVIIDEGNSFQAQLDAPEGHHWELETHAMCGPEWYSGPRSEYWDIILEMIDELPPAVPCSEEHPCEGIEMWGECEWWAKEDSELFKLR